MTVAPPNLATTSGPSRRGAWSRFRRHRLALIGSVLLTLIVGSCFLAPWITKADYQDTRFIQDSYSFPSWQHLFGVDQVGRDIVSRVLYGGRNSLSIAFIVTSFAAVVGVLLGLLAGYYGGVADWFVMRSVEVFSVMPAFLVALLIMITLGGGYWSLVLALALTSWLEIARLVRAEVLSLRERDFVMAAIALGAGPWRILRHHVLPNTVAPIVVAMSLSVPVVILNEAGLSFLGLGINPPNPTWGQMIRDSLSYFTYFWNFALFPALAIGLTVLAVSFVADGLRAAFDPAMEGRG